MIIHVKNVEYKTPVQQNIILRKEIIQQNLKVKKMKTMLFVIYAKDDI